MTKMLVYATAANIDQAQAIARAVVEKNLAACVNIFPKMESVYRWQGKVKTAEEIAMIIKTTENRLTELEKTFRALHSYDVPAFVAIEIKKGYSPFLQWIEDNTKPV